LSGDEVALWGGGGPCFTWRDADRTILFGQESDEKRTEVLVQQGVDEFDLLSTSRALEDASALSSAAAATHEVAPGGVPDAAAALLDEVGRRPVVALGGGRVIDTAKAIGAVGGQPVVAIPTTLSGAEMTGFHRLPAGAEGRARGLVRPSLVLADSDLMTTQPEQELRYSAMNALAHGADSLYTPFANPVSRTTALRGAGLIASSLDQGREQRERHDLALGSILCGYAVDSALFAIHHVICQTLVRVLEIPHAQTNAAILPEAMAFMTERAPKQIAALAEALGTEPESLSQRIYELGRPPRLGELGADHDRLDEALEGIEQRQELGSTPDPPSREHLRAIIEAAW
jgi:alcohol dehydrogenase class IV